ncbi:MAG: hypothetical protein COB24_07450 [Hyphomicrobiales bacterium]|nr:MAG: hypothetical protein COB24_07450 [Hyphomicrobiales bacterium]
MKSNFSKLEQGDKKLLENLMSDGEAGLSDETSLSVSYICNPDGTIRWLFNSHHSKPYFLIFYCAATIKAKIFSFGIRVLYFVRLSNIVNSGEMKISIASESRVGKILNRNNCRDFSIFTGTVGENRKALIELHEDGQTFAIAKIPISGQSQKLVENEAAMLKLVANIDTPNLVVPQIRNIYKDASIELSNVKFPGVKQSFDLKDVHVNALLPLVENSITSDWLALEAMQQSKIRCQRLRENYEIINELDQKRIHKIIDNVAKLIDILEASDNPVVLGIAHGDFTPWNMYHKKNKLFLFDWELGSEATPVLFDYFHFIFQSEILMKQSAFTDIEASIRKMLKLKNVRNLIETKNINIQQQFMFYLISISSYYIEKYVNQAKLHSQSFDLIAVWETAINEVLSGNCEFK